LVNGKKFNQVTGKEKEERNFVWWKGLPDLLKKKKEEKLGMGGGLCHQLRSQN